MNIVAVYLRGDEVRGAVRRGIPAKDHPDIVEVYYPTPEAAGRAVSYIHQCVSAGFTVTLSQVLRADVWEQMYQQEWNLRLFIVYLRDYITWTRAESGETVDNYNNRVDDYRALKATVHGEYGLTQIEFLEFKKR